MTELNDDLKSLIRSYVLEVLAEQANHPAPLVEVFSIKATVRATKSNTAPRSDGQFHVVEPGEYLVIDVTAPHPNEENVTLQRKDGETLPPLITKTSVGLTDLGRALFGE